MAEEQVIIDVQIDSEKAAKSLSAVNQSISALKEQNKQLRKEIEAGNDAFGENSKVVAENEKAIKLLTAQQKALSGQIQVCVKENGEYGDSFRELDASVRALENEYKSLTKAQRESAAGQELKKTIIEQKQALKDFDAELGNHQRNVGNYPTTMAGFKDAMNGFAMGFANSAKQMAAEGASVGTSLSKSFGLMGKSFSAMAKTMLANPIGLILTAVSVAVTALQKAFGKLSEAFKRNDDAGTSLAKLFAIFDPMINGITKALDKLVGALGKAAEWIANLAGKMSKSVAAAQEIITATDNLEEAERQYTVNHAKRESQIDELRAKSVERDKYSVEQRREFLQQALDLQKEDIAERKKNAEERLRIMEMEAKKNRDTSDETKNKIAEQRAKIESINGEYAKFSKELNAQISAFNIEERKQAEATAKAVADAAEEKRKAREEERKEYEAMLQAQADTAKEIEQMVEDFTLSLIKDEGQKRYAERQLQGEREIEQLKQRLQTDETLTAESRQRLNDLIVAKQRTLNEELDEIATEEIKKNEEAQMQALQDSNARIRELKLQLAQEDSAEQLELQREQLAAEFEQRFTAAQENEEEMLLLKQLYTEQLKALDDEYYNNQMEKMKAVRDTQREAFASLGSAASDTFGAMSDLLETYGEENKEAGKASKAFALGSIIVQSAMSIADGARAISAAAAGAASAAAATGPAAPATLPMFMAEMTAAILSVIATVTSTIVSAKQVLGSAKFATGGIVGGTSYVGDKVPVQVNSGEMILNKQQQTRLFEIAQGGTKADTIDYNRLADAIAALPAPVMVYEEFQDFQNRTIMFDELNKQ